LDNFSVDDGKAVVETPCAKCGTVVPAEVVAEVSDAIRVGGEALDEAGSIQFTSKDILFSVPIPYIPVRC
jgi:hypothetical protein